MALLSRSRASKPLLIAAATALLMTSLVGDATAATLPPGGTFADDDGNVHEGYVEAIAAAGITKGCNPPAGRSS